MKTPIISVIAILSVIGCGPPPLCSADGVEFYGLTVSDGDRMPPGWSCLKFTLAVEAVINTFDTMRPQPSFERAQALANFSGASVHIHPETSWFSEVHDIMVSGLTFCETRQMLVHNKPPDQSDAFSHEMAHIAQACRAMEHQDWQTPNDAGVTINAAIIKAREAIGEAFARFSL